MPSKSSMRSALLGLLALTTFTPFATAHTWVEQLMVIAPNGTMVGQPGFPRGNVLRGTPGFGDPAMVNLIPPDGRPANQIQPQDLMCKTTQTSQTQTDGSPRLQAAPGSAIGLRYQENGHVTLPGTQAGKPQNRGTVYVYGTTQPSPDDSFLAIHRVWTPDGSGGDRRGALLSTQNFDDGQCYQVNGGSISTQRQQQYGHAFNPFMGSDLWCQQDIQIPTSAPSGKPYTLYWVWDWPTLPGTPGFPEGKQEIYTTCMDIDIANNIGVDPVSKAQGSAYKDQPIDQAAIKAQMADIANPTAVTGTTIAFSASATGPAAGAASDASISFATQVSTGEPGFLTVHTGSTAGPGFETQTFTVKPIAETAAPGSNPQNPQNGGGGGGGRGPQITSKPALNNQAPVLTLTEYDSVTETVYETVYQTLYTKRDAGESESSTVSPVEYPSPTGESTGSGYPSPTGQGGRHGRPAWATEEHRFGGRPENSTWEQHSNGSRPAWFTSHAPTSAFSTVESSVTSVSDSTATGYVMTMLDGTVMTMPADSESLLSNAEYTTMDSAVLTIVPRSAPSDTIVVTIVDAYSSAIIDPKPTGHVTRSLASVEARPSNCTSGWIYARSAMPHHPFGGNSGHGDRPNAQGASGSGSAHASNWWNIGNVRPDATSSGASYHTTSSMEPGMASDSLYKKRSVFQTHVLTASSAVPEVTPAPSIDIRGSDSELASTAHSAFRLRARNPFVWLGWQTDKNEDAEATPTIHL